jgi:biopolymer transport protein ExbD
MARWKRQESGSAADEFSNTAVFITPMLDMAFQLLAFFVFTYNPQPAETRFTIGLVKSNLSGGPSNETPRDKPKVSPSRQTDIKPLIMIVARENDKRELDRLDLVIGDSEKVIKSAIADKGVPLERTKDTPKETVTTLEKLDQELRAARKNYPSEKRIVIQSTPRLKWEIGMKLMDACRAKVEIKDANDKIKFVPLFESVDLDLIRGR